MRQLKAENFKIYLETNGILWKPLLEVIGWCDLIAMDIKTPSVTHEGNFDLEHKRFLEIAKAKETFIKIIVSKEINLREFENEIRIVAEIAPEIPVVLVPISQEKEGHEDPELMHLMGQLQQIAMRSLSQIRIVPRFHKILNIR